MRTSIYLLVREGSREPPHEASSRRRRGTGSQPPIQTSPEEVAKIDPTMLHCRTRIPPTASTMYSYLGRVMIYAQQHHARTTPHRDGERRTLHSSVVGPGPSPILTCLEQVLRCRTRIQSFVVVRKLYAIRFSGDGMFSSLSD